MHHVFLILVTFRIYNSFFSILLVYTFLINFEIVADRADDQGTHGTRRNDADYISDIEKYAELLSIGVAELGINGDRHGVFCRGDRKARRGSLNSFFNKYCK